VAQGRAGLVVSCWAFVVKVQEEERRRRRREVVVVVVMRMEMDGLYVVLCVIGKQKEV
jgi:hypothetical protein